MLITPQSTHDMIQGIPAADDGEAALEPRRVSRRAPGRQMDTKGAAPPSVDHIFGPYPHCYSALPLPLYRSRVAVIPKAQLIILTLQQLL